MKTDSVLAVHSDSECTEQNGTMGSLPTDQKPLFKAWHNLKSWNLWKQYSALRYDNSTHVWYEEPHFLHHLRQHPQLVIKTPEDSGSHIQSGFSLRWCGGLQLPSYAVRRAGLEIRSTPLSILPFSPFFFFPRSSGHGFRETAAMSKA